MNDLSSYGLDVLVFGVALLLVARARRWGDGRARAMAGTLRGVMVRREGRLALSFGIPVGWWLGLRALVLGAGVTIGVLSRVPAVMAVAILMGLYGFPWSLEGLAFGRRIGMARDLGESLPHIATRLETTGQSLDAVLRDVASRRQGQAARIFAPLAGARDVDAALAQSVARSGLPEAEDTYMVIATARTRPPQVLGSVLTDVQQPEIETSVEFMEQRRAWKVGERGEALIIAACTGAVYWAMDLMPKVHAFHASAAGQVSLIAATIAFAVVLQRASRQHRMMESSGWDTVAAQRELEKLRRG